MVKRTYPRTSSETEIGPMLDPKAMAKLRERIREQPDQYTLQSYLPLSQQPTWREGEIVRLGARAGVDHEVAALVSRNETNENLILQLNTTTGLPLAGQGYGKRLLGGNHARIEGAYILYSPASKYYYLFTSFGGLAALTTVDLAALVAHGRFREDLYYRLNVFRIRLPALRHRKGDVPLLVDYMLQRQAAAKKLKLKRLSDEALDALDS